MNVPDLEVVERPPPDSRVDPGVRVDKPVEAVFASSSWLDLLESIISVLGCFGAMS